MSSNQVLFNDCGLLRTAEQMQEIEDSIDGTLDYSVLRQLRWDEVDQPESEGHEQERYCLRQDQLDASVTWQDPSKKLSEKQISVIHQRCEPPGSTNCSQQQRWGIIVITRGTLGYWM